jgi:hypothetical protein
MLRVSISLVGGLAMLVAQMPPGFAQNAVSIPAQPVAAAPAQDLTPHPAILDAFKAFPKGGDLLSKRIEDIIVRDPKVASAVAKYVQTAPDLNKDQKLAALRGLAAALNRLGIQAAELPVPPPAAALPAAAPPVTTDPGLLLLGLAATAGIICAATCGSHQEAPAAAASVSP